jgi:hypothetical protein
MIYLAAFANMSSGGMTKASIILSIIGLTIAMIAIPIALLIKRAMIRYTLRSNVVTATYEPPAGLSPAELGYLFDHKFDEAQTVATIIDLLHRGIFKQDPDDKRVMHIAHADKDRLSTLENCLVKLVQTKKKGVAIKELTSEFLSTDWKKASVQWGEKASERLPYAEMVHNDLKKLGYAKGLSGMHFFSQALKVDAILVVSIIFLPMFSYVLFDFLNEGGVDFSRMVDLVAVFVILPFSLVPFFVPAMFVGFVRGRITGRTWIRTKKLKKIWRQAQTFREYLRLVEKDKLKFETDHLKKKARNRALPYSIALGLTPDWVSYFFEEEK